MASGLASADSIVQTFSLPTGSTTTPWSASDSTDIAQFYEPGFILNSIEIQVAATGSVSGSGTTQASADYTFNGTTTFKLSANGTSGSLLTGNATYNFDFGQQSSGQNLSQSGATNVTYDAIYNSSGSLLSCSPDQGGLFSNTPVPCNFAFGSLPIANFLGQGFVTFTASASSQGGLQGGNFNNGTFTGTAAETVTVTYNYSNPAVPEPATMALVGGALIGLGILGKRLKKS